MPQTNAIMHEIFKDLRVIELASVLAGPAVGMFFAELGARVIKIENKVTGGDVTRSWKAPSEDMAADYSAYYCSVNWGKTVQLLDLRTTEDQAIVHELVRDADVVISNFRSSSAQRLNMDYETLQAINPKLIFGQITGFGEGDPRPAFDVVLQAEAGFLYMTGEPGGNPAKMPVALIDLLAAHQLKEGILIALLKRERTGEGSYLSVSLFEAAVASLANQATNWLMAGHIPQRMGTQHPNIAPYGDIFTTKDDRQIVIAAGTERQFQSLCAALRLESDERFADNASRVKNRDALIEFLQPAFRQFYCDAILENFHALGVPVASIRNMQEVFELPLARRMILEETMPDGQRSQRVKTVVFDLL